MPRLFLGLETPPDVAAALAALRGGLPGARWVEPSDYHVTLRFVGDVPGDVAEDLLAALAELRPRPPVEVAVEGLGAFGGDRPHAAVAVVAPTPALVELHGEVERAARSAGLEPQTRRFSPHVTLARIRGARAADVGAWIAERAPLPRLAFEARRLAAFSARDRTGGGPYVVEAAFPFA